MKKIIIAITAVLGLAACIKDDIAPVVPVDNENVVLDFSVVVPETQTVTKAFSNTPNITGLTVFVFDENKMLLKAVNAAIADDAATTDRTEFTVTLPQHPSACTVHFVANCPLQTLPAAGSETDIMTTMTTSGTADAYWQCVAVPNLIAANDDLKETLVDTYFTKIPLIRNFAKITVELASTVSGFTLKGYTLINAMPSGTVAPYNTNKGTFESFNNGGTGLGYAALKANSYDGFVPAGVNPDTDVPTSVNNQNPIYTYESKFKDADNATLLVYGEYNGTDGYYKVDFVSSSNTYNNGNFEILRNLHYEVTINSVVGAGYSTIADAVKAVAGNNISASTDTQNLLNISDGTSRLFVDQVVKHIVTTGDFAIKFRYEPTINGDPSNGTATISRSKATETEDAVISAYSTAAADENGWRTITITPKALPGTDGTVYKEELTIKAGNLSRVVTLYLHRPYIMNVECNPTSATAVKTEVTVNTTIPSGLPEEIFPLVFEIEDTQLCLSPNASYASTQGAVPVTTEPSIIPNNTKETFHYKRTLTWAQYSAITASGGNKTFPTYFVTNKAVTGIKVYVKGELFGIASN